ncbi:MAG: thiamine pyrophosphate-binding protein [Burkholderiales bacterium]|nr:MAG: thiamine pyrophosphate-binding protein [Burkholderiales bacterium]
MIHTSRPVSPGPRTGGRLIVDQLLVHGANRAFCVPGESFLAVLDAMHDVRDRLPLVVCRQEGGAANMAEAWGKLTGAPGICFATRGPGATNASIGVHTAFQDSTPMILFIGQVGTDFVEREAFQEVDYRRMFGQMAKWVASIDRADRIPEFIQHAFHVATSGRPGPVVLALPEDVLVQLADVPDALPYRRVQASPSAAQTARLVALLAEAERPLLLVGGSAWDDASRESVRSFAHRFGLPVACAWRYQDAYDNCDAHYVGEVGIGVNPKLGARVREADLLIAVGVRLGEMTTNGYSLIESPTPAQCLVHVFPGADELGRVFAAELPIASGNREFAATLDALAPPAGLAARWAGWLEGAVRDYAAWRVPRAQPGSLSYPECVLHLERVLPHDAILTNGAGNFATPVHRFHRHRRHKTQLAPTSGAMGYAVPAAVAASLAHPDRVVVAFTGDGDFMMTGQELATAVQYGATPIVVLVNNGMYGTIRMHQEREYPARVYGTALRNPDFVKLAEAYGCHGERVTETGQFAAAFERARAAGVPALIELVIDPQAITAGQTIDELRAQALARHKG